MKAKVAVLSTENVPWIEAILTGLRTRLGEQCEATFVKFETDDDIIRAIQDVDIVVGYQVSGKAIASSRHLRMIQTFGTGVDKVDLEAADKRGIVVCNASGFNSIFVAEHAIALILALAKSLVNYDREMKHGIWKKTESSTLYGKTIGILGLGNIGIEVVKRLEPYGMRIIATKRHPSNTNLKQELGIDFLGGPEDINRLLNESDFLLITLPLNAETRGLIGEEELRSMKRTVFLVNVARGEIVDETALVSALTNGVIAGAGLDVFSKEPLPSDNPLLKLENVILTPHASGISGYAPHPQLMSMRIDLIAKNIAAVLNGSKPENIVDPRLRYVLRKR